MTQAPDSTQPLQEVDVYIQQLDGEERITYIRKTPRGSGEQPQPTRRVSSFFLYLGYLALSCLFLFIPSSAATATLPIVTVTIVPKTYTITTTQNVQLPARLLAPLTLSQSQTVQTTGHGHQQARQAQGTITFYNGLFTSQIIAARTILTASDGIQIQTDQSASIPAANPPGLGEITVSAHAIATGEQGNISAYTINQTCCSTAVKAVNSYAFTGGQDERYFSTVSEQDIHKISTQLRETLTQSMQGAFTVQLTPGEALTTPLCSENTVLDHQEGAEATTVTVTVSETCTGAAYDKQSLQEKASQLLTTTAQKQLGTGYSLLGDTKLTINHIAIQNGKAILEITSSGLWMYQLNSNEQQELIKLIAGKSKTQAIHILLSVPGIQAVDIDTATTPQDPTRIKVIILYKD